MKYYVDSNSSAKGTNLQEGFLRNVQLERLWNAILYMYIPLEIYIDVLGKLIWYRGLGIYSLNWML